MSRKALALNEAKLKMFNYSCQIITLSYNIDLLNLARIHLLIQYQVTFHIEVVRLAKLHRLSNINIYIYFLYP